MNEDTDNQLERNQEITEKCNTYVQDFVHAKLTPFKPLNKLQATGISAEEAKSFVQDAADALQCLGREPDNQGQGDGLGEID